MYRKVKFLLSLVLFFLPSIHASESGAALSPGHRSHVKEIKFGLKKSFQPMKVLAGDNSLHVTIKPEYCPEYFFEYKFLYKLGIQIGLNSLNYSKAAFPSLRSLKWDINKGDYKVYYTATAEPIIDSLTFRFYPKQYQKLCIYVSYRKDEQDKCYRSLFGLDYEFNTGITVGATFNKGLEDVQKILEGQVTDLTAQWSIGWKFRQAFSVIWLNEYSL